MGGSVRLSNCSVTSLWLGALEQVGSIWVEDLAIGALDLSALQQTTSGHARLLDMQSVDLSSLSSVAGPVVLAPTGSATVELPMLTSADALDITQADAVVTFQAPLLTSLDDYLLLVSNAALSAVQLPSLGSVGGDFTIEDNPALPTSAAEALRDQVGVANIGGVVSITGNGPG